jgi:heat shock protein HslJ
MLKNSKAQITATPICLLLLMALHSSPSADDRRLIGTWRVELVNGHAVFDRDKTELSIVEDGSVSTTVGCNRIAGKPKIDGDRITFGRMASTMMACLGPMAQLEANYVAALGATRSFQIERSKLTFRDSSKTDLVVFSRANVS